MSIKRVFAPPPHPVYADLALLLLRFVMGIAFITHGWGKIQTPLNWMGEDAFAPGPLQALAAVSEFGGGIFLLLGLLTPLAALGIVCTMTGAMYMHVVLQGDPFVSTGGASWELAAVYWCAALLLLTLGPGRFSIDRLVFRPRATTPAQ
jgi:putative oxidoreductase